jgi:flagellar protein FlaJ
MLKKKKEDEKGKKIIGFTKPKKILFIKVKSKPIYGTEEQAVGMGLAMPKEEIAPQPTTEANPPQENAPEYTPPERSHAPTAVNEEQRIRAEGASNRLKEEIKSESSGKKKGGARPSGMKIYIERTASKQKGLESSLIEAGMKTTPYQFVKKMMIYALILAVIVAVVMAIIMINIEPRLVILGPLVGFAAYFAGFNKFLTYPKSRTKVAGKEVERDILFAARDIVISMRSGMPFYNAIVSVSTGYGAASREFARVVELVQLGMPIEQAMDEISAKSQSKTFKRLMLQASVSIKAGADIIGSLQEVVQEVTSDRVIELRRYGQRLNALAMFYMLFGVIFPSMGIAVAAILTTFISIITINGTILLLALVGIIFLQVIFLNIMRSSRPIFSM